jgi:RNA polymerase sigma-70 factor (ECF subfamily)
MRVDRSVIQRACAGDGKATSELYEACYPRLYKFCFSRLRNEELASDTASDIFEKVLRNLPSYHVTHVPFEAWLFRIARNKVIDTVRRRRRAELHTGAIFFRADPRDQFGEVNDRTVIEQGLDGLNEGQRSVIVMRFIAGYNLASVADAIGKSVPAVKAIQFRALASMRRSIAAGGARPGQTATVR